MGADRFQPSCSGVRTRLVGPAERNGIVVDLLAGGMRDEWMPGFAWHALAREGQGDEDLATAAILGEFVAGYRAYAGDAAVTAMAQDEAAWTRPAGEVTRLARSEIRGDGGRFDLGMLAQYDQCQAMSLPEVTRARTGARRVREAMDAMGLADSGTPMRGYVCDYMCRVAGGRILCEVGVSVNAVGGRLRLGCEVPLGDPSMPARLMDSIMAPRGHVWAAGLRESHRMPEGRRDDGGTCSRMLDSMWELADALGDTSPHGVEEDRSRVPELETMMER